MTTIQRRGFITEYRLDADPSIIVEVRKEGIVSARKVVKSHAFADGRYLGEATFAYLSWNAAKKAKR